MFVRRRVIPCANSDMEWLYSFSVRHTTSKRLRESLRAASFIHYLSIRREELFLIVGGIPFGAIPPFFSI